MIHVLDDSGRAARAVADRIVAAVDSTLHDRPAFRLAVSGGDTPVRTYRLLSSPEYRERIDWQRVVVLFADERAVPPDDPASTYRLVRETLLDPAGVPAERVHRMRGEAHDLEAAARAYEPLVAEPIDLMLLGVGVDGHMASIFPGGPAERERVRRVVAVHDSPKPPPRRLTVTPRVLDEARSVAVLVTGGSKAEVVARVFRDDGVPVHVPARLLRARDWYLDRAAAARLPMNPPDEKSSI